MVPDNMDGSNVPLGAGPFRELNPRLVRRRGE